ncbi:MAG: adenosylcobalamin-dependent ribonucleoside-diphosphate reductase [Arenicellales bacterium]|nr:adenosylcobalamin-dependent ribonucleoside-diphosphate reductase [Arenicellales bacterium]
MNDHPFRAEISRYIWETKYRNRQGEVIHDQTITDTWRRIAGALAQAEVIDQRGWQDRFYAALENFKFLPGGRIQAGAGVDRQVTLLNCFVMGTIEDSMDGIFDVLKEAALTMQQGGGVGCDFSTLRPKGSSAHTVGSVASGPVSFMRIWDAMCATLLSTGNRRGAMMATLRCDHPDIEEFISVKQDPLQLRNFNLSVLVTDAFMQAVEQDDEWPLVFPHPTTRTGESVTRRWPGHDTPVRCWIYNRISARSLWQKIMRATYEYAEPGVLFIDRINRLNNLWYKENIIATNPCGEIPLPPYGACDLGSINLTSFVRAPFSERALFDMNGFCALAQVATRMMDNVISISEYPLEPQAEQARGSRRIGLGITGLADALIMLGYRYGSESSLQFAKSLLKALCHTAYCTSVELAKEKRPFPFFVGEQYGSGEFIRTLPEEIQEMVQRFGIRNSHLTAIAPTGTISLLANNVSSGLEPVFDFLYKRKVLDANDHQREYEVVDYACRVWWELNGKDIPLPPQFVDARSLAPERHLEMQAAVQPFIDNAISKTINIPSDYSFDAFQSLYETAYEAGLKGCTTFRPNPITGEVLTSVDDTQQAVHCCSINREAD